MYTFTIDFFDLRVFKKSLVGLMTLFLINGATSQAQTCDTVQQIRTAYSKLDSAKIYWTSQASGSNWNTGMIPLDSPLSYGVKVRTKKVMIK